MKKFLKRIIELNLLTEILFYQWRKYNITYGVDYKQRKCKEYASMITRAGEWQYTTRYYKHYWMMYLDVILKYRKAYNFSNKYGCSIETSVLITGISSRKRVEKVTGAREGTYPIPVPARPIKDCIVYQQPLYSSELVGYVPKNPFITTTNYNATVYELRRVRSIPWLFIECSSLRIQHTFGPFQFWTTGKGYGWVNPDSKRLELECPVRYSVDYEPEFT